MDFKLQEQLFSRQGKASSHMHPEFGNGPKIRPKAKTIEPIKMSDLKSMLTDLEKKRLDEETEAKNRPKPLTSSFKTISRDEYAFAFRNRTNSPKVGNYSPRFVVIEPRATHTLKLVKHTSVPKERQIFIPGCLNFMNCSFINRKAESPTNKAIKRIIKPLKEFKVQVAEREKNDRIIPKKVGQRLILPLAFDKQKPRSEFVKESDPPNDKRFDYVDNNSPVNTKHKRVQSLPFEKNIPRKEFFEDKQSLSPYDVNKEFIQKKISTNVMEFSRMTERKPLVLEHMLKTPMQIEDEKIQIAYLKQSNIRGHYKIPLMQTVTPRDDIMYRTTELYMLNVPEKQSASTVPRYMGITSPSFSSSRRLRSVI
ncbi:hypothetical protein SteCoe_20444 [Stentor coeruleus]|uniref:Uncharacterized protein n=1 Tax=Stentor coeruleus TaxID=5963 RepID=A0A1R2BRT3_9CILI|nr:hypothetical protein SteCoe_20444 [Stentor coeruleus]